MITSLTSLNVQGGCTYYEALNRLKQRGYKPDEMVVELFRGWRYRNERIEPQGIELFYLTPADLTSEESATPQGLIDLAYAHNLKPCEPVVTLYLPGNQAVLDMDIIIMTRFAPYENLPQLKYCPSLAGKSMNMTQAYDNSTWFSNDQTLVFQRV